MTASPRFPLGQLLSTPGAIAALQAVGMTPLSLLVRHAAGDWGDLDAEDKQLNERALQDGSRIFSAYCLAAGLKVWVITEANRAATTVLLPDEY
ncbi:MAG: hypothetical protein ACRYFS_19895 [Janthinobacterium lividum]